MDREHRGKKSDGHNHSGIDKIAFVFVGHRSVSQPFVQEVEHPKQDVEQSLVFQPDHFFHAIRF
jgi:hypothetical protein